MYFVGVDVGTGSARAALVDSQGKTLRVHTENIITWNPKPDHYEQSSENIWNAVCACVKTVVSEYPKENIHGIGFDATCSLVLLDKSNEPLSVSTTGNNEQNIILWMDHRANEEANFINGLNHEILKYVGDKVSLEMQCPKLLWLKTYSHNWLNIGKAFDLPDFLTWKSTGCDSRSLCSVVCKWNYDAIKSRWADDYLCEIGLHDLIENNHEIIGRQIKHPGQSIGNGLTIKAAEELGLMPSTAVGVSLIDAHAGALALLGCTADGIDNEFTNRIAVICGTSSCHMSVTDEIVWANGFWGPYKSALFPNMYLMEAGQSATGILIDHMIKTHPAYQQILNKIGSDQNIYNYLNELLITLGKSKNMKSFQELSKELHVWPDFHGNRTPIADPTLKGMISGLTMSIDEDNLAILYLSTIQALAYGTKHILNALEESGRKKFTSLLLCGGLSKNSLFVQTHADVCSLPVLLPIENEIVLLGAAILGAFAANKFESLQQASKTMSGHANVITPNKDNFNYHERKYKVFKKMLNDQNDYKVFMN